MAEDDERPVATPPTAVVLLDLDGPILDVRTRYFRAHEEAVGGITGVATLSAAAYWRAKRNRVTVPAMLGIDAADTRVARYTERWRAAIERPDLLALDTLQPDAERALAMLGAVPRRVLVTMRTNAAGARQTLARLALERWFTAIAIVPHATGSKEAAFRAHGDLANPAATVVVGDTELEVVAARALGFRTVGVTNGIRTAEYLAEFGTTRVVDSLTSAAAYVLGDAAPHHPPTR